jgi:DNA-directed RNA polymerase specialized sigma24 family protein
MLEKVFKDHKKWINTVLKFGCSKTEAEDIVGDMYVIIGKMLNNGLNIAYGDEVNYYYIYRTLRTSFLQLCNKKKKENKVPLDLIVDIESGEYIDFEKASETVLNELDNMHWYNKKLFNLVQYEYSITDLSKKTNIPYHSIYNTYRKTKDKLTKKILE